MKKYFYIGIIILIGVLSLQLYLEKKYNKTLEEDWKNAIENTKTYSELFSNSDSKKNRAYKLSIEQLNSSKDSIFQQLCKVKEELKIKDSKLQSLQYMASSYIRVDTITFTDTLFKDPQVKVDTLISDNWYSVKLGLEYPATIVVQPTFKSKRVVAVSMKKETVNPPKKFFLFRWFQKKQYVLNVDVIEENPYVENMDNRYVEIVK